MAQQTAVQWLLEQINKGSITFEMTKKGVFIMQDDNIIEQAKQMEKQQIMNARLSTFDLVSRDDVLKAEQYYNKTYEQ